MWYFVDTNCYFQRWPITHNVYTFFLAHFGKIHNYLERNMQIENSISFFEQNLDYILWEWYKNHKKFEVSLVMN